MLALLDHILRLWRVVGVGHCREAMKSWTLLPRTRRPSKLSNKHFECFDRDYNKVFRANRQQQSSDDCLMTMVWLMNVG